MQRVLLTDVDNTLFSWIDYFAPSFRALVHVVAREAELSEDDLYNSFQLLFQQEGTVEYKKAIQENALIKSLPLERQERALHNGWIAFSMATRRHMKPYQSVIPTLKRLRQDGVRIVAVTNSGALQAMYRMRQMGLSKLLDGMVAWDHDVAGEVETDDYQKTVADRLRWSGLPWVNTLPLDKLKPSVDAYEEALVQLGLESSAVWIIGDSLSKDLSAAPSLKAKSIWAKYGHAFNKHNFETLIRITHWSTDRINSTYDTTILQPDYVAEDFADLLQIIELRQPSLF